VDGEIIRAVGAAEELVSRHPDEPVRRFPGCALLPGFVNAHTHLEYSAFRDFCHPCGFGEWMLRLLLARRKLALEDYGIAAMWGARECARSGITTIADTSFEGWTTTRAARQVGLRARVYLEVFGFDDADLPATMDRLEARLASLEGDAADARPPVELGVSPHAPYTVSQRLYREVVRYCRREGLRAATHVAESRAELELLTEGTGPIAHAYRAAHLWKGRLWRPPKVGPVRYLADAGALGPWMLAVHSVQVTESDMALLAETGTSVAHCPRSNLRLQCGTAPVRDLRSAGVTVGLGTDSLGSNDDLDMFAEMRAALAAAGVDPPAGLDSRTVLGPTVDERAVLRMATLDGARALGWGDSLGSLDPGKQADLVAVRIPGRRPAGFEPEVALVTSASAGDVQMTMVGGSEVFTGDRSERQGIDRDFSAARAKLGL